MQESLNMSILGCQHGGCRPVKWKDVIALAWHAVPQLWVIKPAAAVSVKPAQATPDGIEISDTSPAMILVGSGSADSSCQGLAAAARAAVPPAAQRVLGGCLQHRRL